MRAARIPAMARPISDSILNSLKGRIWLAVAAIAVLNCICGLVAYLTASFFVADPLFSVFATFVLSALTTIAFGWWLSGEVLRPIEKVGLLAQSLERSPATSLPKTTGASETDELLRTLHRNSQQLQNLIGMMDDVAAGKTQTAVAPLQNSDRLSSSFQKLVSKVTDSIDAKRELIALQTAVVRLTREVSSVSGGRLDVSISSDSRETREIAAAFQYLLSRLAEVVQRTQSTAQLARISAGEIKSVLRTAVEADELKTAKLRRASAMLQEAPQRFEAVDLYVTDTISSAERAIAEITPLARTAVQHADAVDMVRKQISDCVRRLQKVKGDFAVLPQTAKTAEDLARRCKLVALNTSLGAPGKNKGENALVFDEISSLSARAESVFRELSTLNESLSRDTVDAENTLKAVVARCSEISRDASGGGAVIENLESCILRLKELPKKMHELTHGSWDSTISTEDDNVNRVLADSERTAVQLLGLLDELSSSATGFYLPAATSVNRYSSEREQFSNGHLAGDN